MIFNNKKYLEHGKSLVPTGDLTVNFFNKPGIGFDIDNTHDFSDPNMAIEAFQNAENKDKDIIVRYSSHVLGIKLSYSSDTNVFNNVFNIKDLSGGTIRALGIFSVLLNPSKFKNKENVISIRNPEAGIHEISRHEMGKLISVIWLNKLFLSHIHDIIPTLIIETTSISLTNAIFNFSKTKDLKEKVVINEYHGQFFSSWVI